MTSKKNYMFNFSESDLHSFHKNHDQNYTEVCIYKLNQELPRKLSCLKDDKRKLDQGIYCLYTLGSSTFPLYQYFNTDYPIYIGCSITYSTECPRQGIRERLNIHRNSILQATNLSLDDFYYKALVLNPNVILRCEYLLQNYYQPLWDDKNGCLCGFGKKNQKVITNISKWDVIHPGRKYTLENLDKIRHDREELLQIITKWTRKHNFSSS